MMYCEHGKISNCGPCWKIRHDDKADRIAHMESELARVQAEAGVMRLYLEAMADSCGIDAIPHGARGPLRVALDSGAGRALADRVKRLEAVAKAAMNLHRYEDFEEPIGDNEVIAPPSNPQEWREARLALYEALAALDKAP